MEHQTLYTDAQGQLRDMDCPCGEDHGPSVDEERRWLLQENDRLRARVAELEAVQKVSRAHIADLDNELAERGELAEELLARVAELEAERGEPTGTEWGVRYATGTAHSSIAQDLALATVSRYDGAQLVSRTLGPWRAAQ